jgi:hypothetical protein
VKRLDDSNDAVRVVGAGALAALARIPRRAEVLKGVPAE